MLETEDGVIAALPYCDKGLVEVWASKKDTLDVKKAEAVIHMDQDFEVKSFQKAAPGAKAKAMGTNEGGKNGGKNEGGKKKRRRGTRRRG